MHVKKQTVPIVQAYKKESLLFDLLPLSLVFNGRLVEWVLSQRGRAETTATAVGEAAVRRGCRAAFLEAAFTAVPSCAPTTARHQTKILGLPDS